MSRDVLVYGAYGHTGRFVVAELLRRGMTPVVAGRDPAALEALGSPHPGLVTRLAAVDDAEALDRTMQGVSVVVNCAGPFLDTGLPVAAAAVRAGAHYLDISAEQAAVQQIYQAHDGPARGVDVSVIPGMAFYGGLADLMTTAATTGWATTDTIDVAIGIDRWWPTAGTRRTGRRNTATRLIVDGGALVPAPDPATVRDWDFPGPLGRQRVIGSPFSEIITIARHVIASSVRTYLTRTALEDVRDPDSAPPRPVDESGRSAQQFVVEMLARRGTAERRISAAGQDIYAATAPLVVEAAERLLDRRSVVRGAAAPGEAFDARDFLDALSPAHLVLASG